MRVERFKASTMREALAAVKSKLGEDAVILHSRSKDDEVEIIAAREEAQKSQDNWLGMEQPKVKKSTPSTAHKINVSTPDIVGISDLNGSPQYTRNTGLQRQHAEETLTGVRYKKNDEKNGWEEVLAAAMKDKSSYNDELIHSVPEKSDNKENEKLELKASIVNEEMANIKQQQKLWIKSEKKMQELRQEIAELKEVLLRQELADLRERAEILQQDKLLRKNNNSRKTTQNRADIYKIISKKLQDRGITSRIADHVVENIWKKADLQKLSLRTETGLRCLRELLNSEVKKLINITPQKDQSDQTIKTIAFVGPNGSGKTTSCIKLALKSSLIHDKKVALILVSKAEDITIKHLGMLASVAKLPMAFVSKPSELASTIRAHLDKDIIFIDFAIDEQETVDLKDYIKSASPSETHLVLSATTKLDDAKKMVKKFDFTGYNRVLFTHFDELKKAGHIIPLSLAAHQPLSYISNGQVIPDHIESANATKLTYLILKG